MSENARNNLHRGIWALAGVYLVYLAYQIVKGAAEDNNLKWYIILIAIAFVFIGILLLYKALKLFKEQKETEKAEAEAAEKELAEKAAAEQIDAAPEEVSAAVPADEFKRDPEVKAVILAAGKGTRMKSDLPKVLHEIEDKPMALYVKEAACAAGASKICFVVGYQKEKVRIALADPDVTFAVQEEQLGTGHAVKCAKDFIGTQGDVFVLCGDTPLITGKTLSELLKRHREQGNAVTVLSAKLDDPYGYGRIVRDENGSFERSVEEKDATEEERAIREGNVGMYVFRAQDLSEAVEQLTNENAQGEYYLPDTLMILAAQGKKVDAYCIESTPEILGVNTPEQLSYAAQILKERNA